jgi:alkylation response protein AidB-like acyl-CoA dehydrogenase
MTTLSADEAKELSASVRAACDRSAPESRFRAVLSAPEGGEQGFGARLWRALCRQVGVSAIGIPEALGGAGHGVATQALIAHELGRALAPVPYVASAVLATELLVAAAAPTDLLRSLADGETTAAAVLPSHRGSLPRHPRPITGCRRSNGWTLRGTAKHVLNGSGADHLVVAAAADGDWAIFVLPISAYGVSISAENVLDHTRPMATVTFTDAPAQRLRPPQPVDSLVDRCLHRALAVLSAEQVGACERILEMATEYARTREQFGRPIGSFQAIKHRCANMLVELEMARSASMAAVQSIDDNDDEAGWRVSMAKAVCSEALRESAHANLQIHGGIGFTAEHPAGMFVKRARTDEVLFGTPAEYWDRLSIGARLFT